MAFHTLAIEKKHGRPMAISCHSWNGDRTQIAFCPNNNELHIARWDGSKFTTEHVLKEHDQLITSVDWAPRSNRIVTCSQDRNAYVWSWEGSTGVWQPTMVMLHMNRAATFVRWSPSERKFAVASGQKTVAVCHFEDEFNWWASKMIENAHNSTVMSLAWHPSDVLLATGSSDGRCRIISVAVKGCDKKPAPVFGNSKPSKFGLVEAILPCGGWVHSVAFSSNGSQLAFASHDSTLHILPLPDTRKPTIDDVIHIQSSGLPMRCMIFVGEDRIVAAGHDCNPTIFGKHGGTWKEGKKLDAGGKGAGAAAKTSAMSSAFRKFETASARAGEDSSTNVLDTIHQNAISDIRSVKADAAGNVAEFSTTGVDGRLVFWNLAAAEAAVGGAF